MVIVVRMEMETGSHSIEPDVYHTILKNIDSSLSLSDLEKKKLVSLYGSLDKSMMQGKSRRLIIDVLSKILADSVTKNRKLENEKKLDAERIDKFRDYQIETLGSADISTDPNNSLLRAKKGISVGNVLGVNSLDTFRLLINPDSMFERHYVALDSTLRDTAASVNGLVSWKYAPYMSADTGFCTSARPIKNIVRMRMYPPQMYHDDLLVGGSGKNVSVLVHEFANQAFIMPSGRRFHFLWRVRPPSFGNLMMELEPEDYNDTLFYFRKPISGFDSITLSYGNPETVLNFQYDIVIIPAPPDSMLSAIEFICLK